MVSSILPEPLPQNTQGRSRPSSVRRPRTREIISTARHPNFKSAGRTVDSALLRIVGNLQRRHGEAWASEAGLRQMICEDTGRMPGLDTIRRALSRLGRQGVLEQVWLRPGGVLPDGSVCTHGTRLILLPQCRRARLGLAHKARREGETRRVQRRMVATLAGARASAFKPMAPPAASAERAADLDAKRRADTARLAELARQWQEDPARGRPPSG